MSTPTQPMPGADVRTEISRFVAAVDAALDDLPRDDAAELTDGLEADLAEAWAAEGVSPTQRFGSPDSYAAELRAAAGLPSRRSPSGLRGLALDFGLSRGRAGLLDTLRAKPWWPQLIEYGRELRPAWWALRGVTLVGLVIFAVVAFLGFFSFVLALLVFLPAAIWAAVVSMRAGAADMNSTDRRGRLITLANLLVVVTLFLAAVGFVAELGGGQNVYVGDEEYPSNGLMSNGEVVKNVFAYDADGKPITRFRLYDQSGRPLITVEESARYGWDDSAGEKWAFVPDSGKGPQEWNLFPMLKVTQRPDASTGGVGDVEVNEPDPPPYAELPALPPSSTETAKETAKATPKAEKSDSKG